MANDWYTADQSHLLVAKKMATWRNGDAKLTSSGVHASDEYIAGRLREPIGIAEPTGASNSNIGKWRTTRYQIGTWYEVLRLQTARNLYPFFGVCATTEATPNVHDLSLRVAQTPINMGRHWERENTTTAESERIDILGLLPYSTHIECSEIDQEAKQYNSWMCSFTKNSSTDDITAASLTDDPYRWEHFTFPTFTYNSETIEANIIGWSFDIMNGLRWAVLDSSGYYTVGKVLNFQLLATTLEIIPYGHNAFELIRTALESYATDLDLVVKCARNATTDYIQWTHDKLYCSPYDIAVNKTPGNVESYRLTMHQLSTGSLTIQAKDAYNNDYYENP